MKISKCKKELARIISENGGWRNGNYAVQDRDDKEVWFMRALAGRPDGDSCWPSEKSRGFPYSKVLTNWHQTALSRAEYFHLYPAQDADGWIEWGGGECPVGGDVLVCCKWRSGKASITAYRAGSLSWRHNGNAADVIAYRLHKQQPKPELCESVVRSIPEPDEQVWTNPPSIEQLAADYRNANDYAERKRQEADAAKADADSKLKALEIAGEALGLLVPPITAKQEPELATVQVGDEVECVESNIKRDKYNGMVGRLRTIDESDTSTPYLVDFGGEANIW